MKQGLAILLCAVLSGLSYGQLADSRQADPVAAQPQQPSLTYNQLITSGYDLLKTGRIGEAYLAATQAALKDASRFEAYALTSGVRAAEDLGGAVSACAVSCGGEEPATPAFGLLSSDCTGRDSSRRWSLSKFE